MKLIHPSTILICGPTGSGKTVFLSKLISSLNFDPEPNNIIWVYNEWQPLYDQLSAQFPANILQFMHGGGENTLEKLYGNFTPNKNNMLILDDQMNETENSNVLSKFFTEGSHHRNLTVIYLVQNLFSKGKSHRTVSINTQYLFLFKNPRDRGQIEVLARQMYPGKSKFVVDSYVHATRKPYSYLLFDFRPETPDELRILTKILPSEVPVVYVPL